MDNTFGKGDSTFRVAGRTSGVKNLVDSFYEIMKTDSQFSKIWSLHPIDNELSKEKPTCFLTGWMGGNPWCSVISSIIEPPTAGCITKFSLIQS